MAAINISSLKTSAYSSIETRNTHPSNGMTPLNLSAALTEYGNHNILSGTLKNGTNNGPLKPKIRIQKKNANNKPLVNLQDENLFTRNVYGNNYVTTKSIIDEATSQRLERNYSYIEAIKEDLPYNTKEKLKDLNVSNRNNMSNKKKCETLPINGYSNQYQGFLFMDKNSNKKPPLSIPSTSSSPSTSSPSSTTSSTLSQKQRNINVAETLPKNVNISSPVSSKKNSTNSRNNNTSNLSKSASQSSILTIFKNTFSPFAIRKWRSKSRDKIIRKNTELTLFNPSLEYNTKIENTISPVKPRAISPEMSNQHINTTHKSIKNNYFMQSQEYNTQQDGDSINSDVKNVYQKKQLTPNQIKIKRNYIKKNLSIETNEPILNNISISNKKDNVDSPRSFLTSATNNKSKIENSSIESSSLSSNDSSIILQNPTNNISKDQSIVENSNFNQINSYFNNISPKMSNFNKNSNDIIHNVSARQKSERNNTLTCMLNGYITKTEINEDLFNSQSTTNVTSNRSNQFINQNSYRGINSENTVNSSYSSNRDSMNKSADVLSSSERFYDLKKKVSMNINNNKANNSERVLQPSNITNNQNINYIVENTNLPEKDAEEVKKSEPIILTELTNNSNNIDNEQSSPKISNNEFNATTQCTDLNEFDSKNKDGDYFSKLLDGSTIELNILCQNYQKYIEPTNTEFYITNEDSLGEVQTTIGKAQLLINKKFKQFRGLCVKNVKDKTNTSELKEGEFVTLDDDLAGFWDMVCLQIDEIHSLFKNLDELKANNWEYVLQRKVTKPVNTKKTEIKKPILVNNNNQIKPAAEKKVAANRSDARGRLIAAKKAAALKLKNQNNDVEIFE